jgi:hypothetical protein
VKPRKTGATSTTTTDSDSEAGATSDAAAAQAQAQSSNPWHGEDAEDSSSEWDNSEGAELLLPGTQLPPLDTVLREQSAALSMAALALLALRSIASGEMTGKQALLLIGSLFLVPLVHLIKG